MSPDKRRSQFFRDSVTPMLDSNVKDVKDPSGHCHSNLRLTSEGETGACEFRYSWSLLLSLGSPYVTWRDISPVGSSLGYCVMI